MSQLSQNSGMTALTATSAMPLEQVDDSTISLLGHALWSWPLCTRCSPGKQCPDIDCARRVKRLQRFFQFYKTVVETYVEGHSESNRVFKTHEDLCDGIRILKSNPDMTRTELKTRLCRGQCGLSSDTDAAAMLTVRVLTMVNCSPLHQSSDRLEKGSSKIYWADEVAFSKYLQDLFPTQNHPAFSSIENDMLLEFKSELRARKLKKHLGLKLLATHDVRNHLRFDRRNNILEIFHFSAFLKEQLRVTKGNEDYSIPSTSIKVGSLPRQLVLEILDSLQEVLFPLCDAKSRRLLESLVRTCSFDPDITKFERNTIRGAGEGPVPYVFLADRLCDLYNEIQNPRPRNWLERQLQRKSGARHMLMATLLGVIFAVLLGVASLAVSSYQTWIAYQAWQHPVVPPTA